MRLGDPSLPVEIRVKVDVFVQIVEEHLTFLGELFYEGPRVSLRDDKLLKHWTQVRYQNTEACREVCVGLVPVEDGDPRGDTLSIDLWRLPSSTFEDQLSFNLFIRKHRPDLRADILDIRTHSGSFRERLGRVLALSASLLDSEARSILTGERWEEGFYHPWV